MLARVIHRIGRRGAALAWFAVLDLIVGVSLLDPRSWPKGEPAQTAYAVVLMVAPYQVWGCIWIGVGLVCAIQAFMARDRLAFAAAITLKIAWGACFLGSWLLFGVYRGWLSVAIWFSFAAFVAILAGWPESTALLGARRTAGRRE